MITEATFKCHSLLEAEPLTTTNPFNPSEELEIGTKELWAGTINGIDGRLFHLSFYTGGNVFYLNLEREPNRITEDILEKYGWIDYYEKER